MKSNIVYQRWLSKRLGSIDATLKVMDLQNKTHFMRRKERNSRLLEEAARQAHLYNQIYYATIGSDIEHPFSFLEISNTRIIVGFLDENKRNYLSYDWYKEVDGKLFLNNVKHYEYIINKYGDDEISKQVIYTFQTNGAVKVIEYDNIKEAKEIFVPEKSLSKKVVDQLWIDYPNFGEYDELIKLERVPIELFR